MASQTISSNASIGALEAAGLGNGQNITINAGALLTFDQSPSVLIGQSTINEGEYFADGENASDPIIIVSENAEEININGAGTMRTSLGWWVHPTTSTGAANQTWDMANYFTSSPITADVFSGVWVETGRRINYDGGSGVAPLVGDWVFKAPEAGTTVTPVHGRIVEVSGDGLTGHLVVQMLSGSIADNDEIELHTLQDNAGPDHQISWTANANGADVLEPDVWQEFGNARQNAINGLGLLGSGYAGLAFDNAHGSNTLTFGDGVNGFIPPAGARIRVPMVHFATATIADFLAGNTTWMGGNVLPHNIETINGGDCYLHGCSLGSVWFEDNLGGEFEAYYCASNGNFGVYASLGRPTYDHCTFVSEIEGDGRSRSRSVPPIVDLVSGADIRDCLGVFINDAAETTQFGGQTSIKVNYERIIQISTSNTNECELLRISTFTMHDFYLIGTQMVINTSTDGDMRLIKTQRRVDATVGDSDQIYFSASSSRIKLRGWDIPSGSCPDDSKLLLIDVNNIDVACFGFAERPFDNEALGGLQGEEFVSVGGLSFGNTISRCYQDRGNPNEFAFIAAGTSKDTLIQNCSGEASGEAEPDGISTLLRSLVAGSGNAGGTSGIETDYPGTSGAMFGDLIRENVTSGPTTGLIYYRCVPGNADYPITILAGAPTFTKDGDVDVQAGDQWEADMGYAVRGHSGFEGTIASVRAGGTTNVTWNWAAYLDVELQYDDGAGFNGVWIDVTDTATMGAIVFNPAGTRFKFRFTATANQTNIQAFTLRTNTSFELQQANLYPIDQIEASVQFNINFAGQAPASYEWRLYVDDPTPGVIGTVEIAGNETETVPTIVYDYQYAVDQDVKLQIIAAGYTEALVPAVLRSIDQIINVPVFVDTNI